MKKTILFFAALACSAIAASAMQVLPNDPAVKVGQLDNGLTYYIRHNDKPAQRAEFYLATHAGAIQETPDQDGLAHFLEHMCFNGLKNLPGKQMLDYLQGIGAEFGRNINAATGVETTSYMLNNIPVTRSGIIDTCLLVMHDYSHFVVNDPEEIDKERGVIIEERRTRRTSAWRMYEQTIKYVFKGCKYADCTLIGSQENLENFKPESLVNFYETWYRPDNQALIVVGDIDVDDIEARIKALFADIPAAVDPKPRDVIKIPDNKEPIVGVVTDPESGNSSIEIIWKGDAFPREYNNTVDAVAHTIVKNIISMVSAERFQEITSKPDAPYLGASLSVYKLCETNESVSASVGFKDGEIDSALKAFFMEVEKIRRYGFSDSEIDRAKTRIISSYEKALTGAESRKNGDFVKPLISNFNNNTSFLEPALALEAVNAVCPQLTPAIINRNLARLITDENMVVIFQGPEKEGVAIPTEEQILSIIAEAKAADIKPNEEVVIASSFVDPESLSGSPVKKSETIVKGATEWTLKNGVKIAVLPTDYKKDQVIMRLYKDGGFSMIPDADIYSFESNILQLWQRNCGVSKYSGSEVVKMLSGKQVSVGPYFSDITHGINASCQPKDLETAFQLMYLIYADPRFDQDEFDAGVNQIKAVLPNLVKTPDFAFQNQMAQTLYSNKDRHPELTMENVGKADLKVIEKNYRALFNDAAGLKLLVVGNVDPQELKPLVEKYIGSIQKGRKAFKWKKLDDRWVGGNVENHFNVEMKTPKATVYQNYNVYDIKYSPDKVVAAKAAGFILDMIYVETLREDEGGTYGASASVSLKQLPDVRADIQVYFDTNVDSADKLARIAREGLEKLAYEGPTEEQMTRVRENLKKNIPESRISNSWWLSELSNWYRFGIDWDDLYEKAVANLTPESIKAVLQEILGSGNYVELVMTPSNTSGKE